MISVGRNLSKIILLIYFSVFCNIFLLDLDPNPFGFGSVHCDPPNAQPINVDNDNFETLDRLKRSPDNPVQNSILNPSATTVSNLNLTTSSLDISNSTNNNETVNFNNGTSNNENNTSSSSSSSSPSTSSTQVPNDPILPQKGAAEEERNSSMAIFFVLSVIGSCMLLIHFILETKFQYIPESLAVVFLGAAIGLFMKISSQNVGDWKKEETMNPTMFFLILLPPIIYESGYTLHKGNFFQNIGSILVFAIVGTSISAFFIGGGVYILGLADVAYKLSFTESFAFGSLISAVDPVATLAIFHALNIDPILNMLVFGESILNDAIAIVLATTALELNHASASISGSTAIFNGFVRFCIVFFGSAAIGAAFALIAALVFKYIDLRKHPSLEFGMMLIFIYAPYGLAEGLHLSGIMAILFNGVVMSHYAHFNLSPVTQITMQQTLRTLAFIAETCVFAYLGLAIFSFHMKIELSLIVWSIVLCLIGRALNIYPLSYFVNYFREHKISKRMMFVMWFSGLRGTIAYALALHLDFEEEKRRAIITTTLIIVLFTIIILGGSTMPVMKYMNSEKRHKGRRRRGSLKARRPLTLSKTKEMGQAIETEHLSELTEEEFEVNIRNEGNLKGFALFDARYLMPFFTRRFTDQEVKDCKSQMTDLTNRWYQTVRRPSDSDNEREEFYTDDDDDDDDDIFASGPNTTHNNNNDDLEYEYENGCYADDEEGQILSVLSKKSSKLSKGFARSLNRAKSNYSSIKPARSQHQYSTTTDNPSISINKKSIMSKRQSSMNDDSSSNPNKSILLNLNQSDYSDNQQTQQSDSQKSNLLM